MFNLLTNDFKTTYEVKEDSGEAFFSQVLSADLQLKLVIRLLPMALRW